MEQVKPFKASRAGTKPYWCLQNVRLGYGLGPKHAYALLDWQKNLKQHKNQKFPAGVAVPVYWNWTGTVEGHTRNWGHIGVRLPDGRIWTDGKYFKSVAEVSSKYLSGGAYLGWGESVEGVRVVKEEDMYNGKTAKQWWQRAVELDESRNAWRDTARKLQTKVDKIASERDLLNAKLTQIEKELKSCQDAVQALRSAESAKPVKDTTDDQKPQIDTSTQAREGVWDWVVDLFNKLRRN